MIDTIVLLLPFYHFTITQLNKFTPNAQFVYSHTLLRAVQNPLKGELKNGVYKSHNSRTLDRLFADAHEVTMGGPIQSNS